MGYCERLLIYFVEPQTLCLWFKYKEFSSLYSRTANVTTNERGRYQSLAI